jgi:hypothetical protein
MHIIKNILRGGASRQLALMAFLIVAVALVLQPATLAAMKEDANDSVQIDVNITTRAAIEVLPTSISWVQIIPGSNGTASTTQDVRNITVKNIGSFNLTDFYLDVNTEDIETTNPVASGQITDYAAGGFVLFRNETTTLRYFHAGRLEWNLTEVMAGENLDLSAGVVNFSHGWYKMSSGNEYLWKVENGTCGGALAVCNCTDANLVISELPENSTGQSRDLSANIATAPTPAATNINWSLFHYNSSQGGPLQDHCVAVSRDCTKIFIYKYDKTGAGSGGFGDCMEAEYLAEERVEPGERLDELKVKPSVPYGTPAGDAKTTTLAIFTSIDYN